MYLGSSIYDSDIQTYNDNNYLNETSYYNTSLDNDIILVFIPDSNERETRTSIIYRM